MTVPSVHLVEVSSTPEGWAAGSASAQRVEGTLRSSSGALVTTATLVDLVDLGLSARTRVGSGTLSGVEVSGDGARVARADRVELGASGEARIVDGEVWTGLVGPHALDVPPVVSEHVPKGLGGSAGAQGSWWDVALGDLPWVPTRITGGGTLHLKDPLLARKSWEVVAETFTLGPFGGSSAKVSATGTVAGGRFTASGTAQQTGRLDLQLDAKGLDAELFEPYAGPLLAASGLGVGPGRIQVDLDLSLTPERLQVGGDLAVRDLALVVADKRRLGARLLTAFSGGRLSFDDRHVPVSAACRLAEPACSPIGELAADVVTDLVDAATNGLAGGVRDALEGKDGKGRK